MRVFIKRLLQKSLSHALLKIEVHLFLIFYFKSSIFRFSVSDHVKIRFTDRGSRQLLATWRQIDLTNCTASCNETI